jgi:hypothetical protein
MAMDTATARIEVLRIMLMESLIICIVIHTDQIDGLKPFPDLSGHRLTEKRPLILLEATSG